MQKSEQRRTGNLPSLETLLLGEEYRVLFGVNQLLGGSHLLRLRERWRSFLGGGRDRFTDFEVRERFIFLFLFSFLPPLAIAFLFLTPELSYHIS